VENPERQDKVGRRKIKKNNWERKSPNPAGFTLP
jgi:hypothetical protein